MKNVKLNIKIAILILFCAGYSISVAQELKPIKLPAPQTEIGKPLMQALKLRSSSRSFSSKPLPLQDLSNLLWAADGINRPETNKRTAPSAMNWQEVDIYVFLKEGVFLYEPKQHTLLPVLEGDHRALAGTQDFVKDAPVNFVYVADMDKAKAGNQDDAKMYSAAACGFIAQNVYLYCASENLVCVIRAFIDKAKISSTLNLRPAQKPFLGQTIGYAK